MMNLLVLASMMLVPSYAPAVQIEDGRTAWLLRDGDAVGIEASAPFTVEIRFHGDTAHCASTKVVVEVVHDGRTVAALGREAGGSPTQNSGYRDFPALRVQSVQHEVPPSATGVTVLRLKDAPCGASITAL